MLSREVARADDVAHDAMPNLKKFAGYQETTELIQKLPWLVIPESFKTNNSVR